ncbi:MAG: Yip1 family protein [Casimicrobiaceae bacterium]
MNLVDRVKNILLSPKTEWPKIAGEAATTQSLYVGYIVILAAVAPLALLIHSGGIAVTMAVMQYVIALVITFLMALIVDALAPTFGGAKDFTQSLKLVAYSYTAPWVAGVFLLLGTTIGGLIGLLAAIYAWYTFYLGVPVLKKCPPEKAVGYTIVVVLCGIVLAIVLGGLLMSALLGGGMAGAGMGLIH